LLNKILFCKGYILANIFAPSVEENFSDESGNTVKPLAIADYNTHLDCVDKNDQMATSYSLS
jgi:glutamine cyclotransferase